MKSNLTFKLIVAMTIPFIAAGAQWILWPYLNPLVWFAFFPAVFLSARIAGLWGGISGTLLSTLLAWYLFIPTQLSWRLEHSNSMFSMLMFLLIGYAISIYLHRLTRAGQEIRAALNPTLAACDKTTQGMPQTSSAPLWGADILQQSMLNSLVESVLVFSPEGKILACNRAAELFFGCSLETIQSNLRPVQLLHENGTPFLEEDIPVNITIRTKAACRNVPVGYADLSGMVRWVLANCEPVIEPLTGEIKAAVLSLLEISEQKKNADEQLRLNRTLRAYSASDWALVHATDESAYINQVCQILVEECNYVMAWVGFAEHNPEKTVRPVGKAGDDTGYLDEITISWEDNEYGSGPSGRAIRTGKMVVCHHMLSDPTFIPWRAQAQQRGYAASISLPLIANEQTLGAIMVYSSIADPFVNEELKILQELANDLAYGIAVLRIRAAHADQEQALRASELRYRLLVEQTVDGIFLANAQGQYIDVNQAGAAMLGYSTVEICTLNISDVIAIEEIGRIPDEVARFKNGSVVVSEWQFKRKDGSIFLGEVVGRQIENGCIQGILRDITFRREAENELQRARLAALNLAQDALEARAKLEILNDSLESEISDRKLALKDLEIARNAADLASRAKSDFLANMSHEIRTPMNAIIGLTRITLDSELAPKQRDHLRKVYNASRALLNILDDILDYSKIEANKLEIERVEFILEDVIRECFDLFMQKLQEKELELFIEIDPLISCSLLGDPLRLGQILNNLINNAIKFTQRGEIHIRAALISENNQTLNLKFSVRDTGIGMDQSQQDRLFNAFTQADSSITRKYGGSGLGLTISKRLVELMGGALSVASEKDIGSEFTFNAYFERCASLEILSSVHRLNPMRVLIVDAHPTSQKVLIHYFGALSFDITATTSVEEAIARSSALPQFDLLITNHCSQDATNRLHDLQKTAAIAVSASILMVTANDRENHLETHNEIILTKPATLSKLINALLKIQQPEFPSTFALPERRIDLYQLAAPIRGAHILLVEDDEINQEIATEFLVRSGLIVVTANNGAEAFALVQQQAFDAVLMDIHMPVMDGFESTRLIRTLAQGKTIPIIALSASAMAHEKLNSSSAGMSDHVSKPFDPAQLITTLLKWIAHKPPHHSEPNVNMSARTPVPAPHQLSGINYADALSRLQGNENLLNRLLQRFATEHTTFSQQLENLLQEQLFDKALSALHRIRGTASTLGVNELTACAMKLESEIKAQEKLNSLPEFIACLGAVIEQIHKNVSGENRLINPCTHPDQPMVETYLANLAICIENHEMFDEDMLTALLSNLGSYIPRKLVAQLESQLNNFDFNQAELTLVKIRDTWKSVHNI
ncbi:response regulator [Gallionella capsiferriformans]|uniref:Sensory/regulatory protein RpfC n=1 Tax=Gallionella capsiferriformans (strain ES-2) TaxID=395494 RepID=D9SIT0_GALCS|nr:response regulator [Gallionella capsiferriformans]ADL56243.1 multi-sensor hybrid histidine kinase [Gallionella capsiferriformans ES-2]